jgi:hypothetical protein
LALHAERLLCANSITLDPARSHKQIDASTLAIFDPARSHVVGTFKVPNAVLQQHAYWAQKQFCCRKPSPICDHPCYPNYCQVSASNVAANICIGLIVEQ